jgi:DNA-binding phage protein
MSDYAATARGFARVRKNLGWTYYKWSKESGLPWRTLVRLEQEDARPTFDTIARAANALGYKATIAMTPLK